MSLTARISQRHLRTIANSVSPKSAHSSIIRRHASFNLGPTASPPRLPDKEQKIFEELQRRSTGAFMQQPSSSTPSTDSSSSSSTSASTLERIDTNNATAAEPLPQDGTTVDTTPIVTIQASGKGEELHPHMRRGAPPEFEGDTNPKTGEVGGPKNEPLRWGGMGDWSYNGRTTDF